MKVVKVIAAKRWQHASGKTASVYGASPWTNEDDKLNWRLILKGWMWENSNGTIGLGRQPAETYQEAIDIMNKINGLGTM